MKNVIFILEKVTPIRIERLLQRVKVIILLISVLICSDPSLQGGKWTKTKPSKCPQMVELLSWFPVSLAVYKGNLFQEHLLHKFHRTTKNANQNEQT